MRIAALLLAIGIFWSGQAYSVESLGSSHVHEAFMNAEAPVTLLIAIPQSPPSPLLETIPEQTDPQSVWVAGYWEWSLERNEFVWCSGCWRRSPPGHQWISGAWQQLGEGWVRVKGFWSSLTESQLTYIPKSPPDPYDEHPTNPPGQDYFWMSGYWKYAGNQYTWYAGKWEKLDQNWLYVPARYVWRAEGYVFVPAFWDWPLDQRGIAYACVAVPQGQTQINYLPGMILEPMALLEGCLLYYPDYYYFYFHYCHFHIDWWWGCAWCPPWWGWDSWWWLPWWDQWGLWWWWCNAGFPAPFWLDAALMDLIFGPPMALKQAMQGVHPPLVIGPHGLIPPANLIDAADNNQPVFPKDPKDVQEEAGKDVPQGGTGRPQGQKVPNKDLGEKAPPAPETTPRPPTDTKPGRQPVRPKAPPSTVPTPPKPTVPPTQPPTTRPPTTRPPTYQPPQRPTRPPTSQPPTYQPPQRPTRPPTSQPPTYQPPQRPTRPPSEIQPSTPMPPPSRKPQYKRQQSVRPGPQSIAPSQRYTPQSPSQNLRTPQTPSRKFK